MDPLSDHLNKMGKAISQANTPTSSNTEEADSGICRICGGESICEGLGVIRYDVPTDDPRFGKMFRCPNNRIEMDIDRQERMRRISNLDAYSDKSFYNFVIDPNTLKPAESGSLQVALSLAEQFAENPEGWLLLEGQYGCGKTHLAAAVGNIRLQKGDSVLFITTPDLLDHLRSTFGPSSETGYDETFDRIRNVPILILDDLGAENASEWAQEKLFQLLNHRYSRRLSTVITTNVDLDALDPRVRSRLLDNALIKRVKIVAPDYRTSIVTKQYDILSNLALYSEMTFDTFETRRFVTSDEERRNLEQALKVAMDYAESPANWLVLTGPYGSGKTHLAAAIAHYQQMRGVPVMFVTVPDLLDYLRVTFSPDAPVRFDQMFQKVRTSPFLVLDDLLMEGSSWAKEKLFQIVDYRYVTQLPTVITTYRNPKDLDPRLRSRILDRRKSRYFAIIASDFATRLNTNRNK
ncbi:MAG: ATP-binding protein [Chloroflexota bacterium]